MLSLLSLSVLIYVLKGLLGPRSVANYLSETLPDSDVPHELLQIAEKYIAICTEQAAQALPTTLGVKITTCMIVIHLKTL
jgi:hypothetical protein